jgi:hypothetical protein
MCSFRFTISPRYCKEVEKKLKVARDLGDLREIKRLLVILAVLDQHRFEQVAAILRLDVRTVEKYLARFVIYSGARRARSRPGGQANCSHTRKRNSGG